MTLMDTQPVALGDLLAEMRSIYDQREQLAEQDKKLSARKAEIEAMLIERSEIENVDKFSAPGTVSVTISDDMRASYDPEKWSDLVAWAVQTNNLHLIQRRLTDARVKELVENGEALPEGLTLTPFKKISIRRN